MSKERCEAVKQLLKQAVTLLQSKACGEGRGISLAIIHAEDSYMRIDFHMRENGWTPSNSVVNAKPVAAVPLNNPLTPPAVPGSKIPVGSPPVPAMTRTVPRVNTMRPAAAIPQLNTGLMNANTPTPQMSSNDPDSDLVESLGLLD